MVCFCWAILTYAMKASKLISSLDLSFKCQTIKLIANLTLLLRYLPCNSKSTCPKQNVRCFPLNTIPV